MFLCFPFDEEFHFDSDHIDRMSGIEDLGFRVNDYNYLRSLGFSTVGQLLEKDGWYYFNLPRHSLRKFERFIRRLDTLGFRVKDASAEQYPDLEQYFEMFRQAEAIEFAAEMERQSRPETAKETGCAGADEYLIYERTIQSCQNMNRCGGSCRATEVSFCNCHLNALRK